MSETMYQILNCLSDFFNVLLENFSANMQSRFRFSATLTEVYKVIYKLFFCYRNRYSSFG
jgi:hypothetical protein